MKQVKKRENIQQIQRDTVQNEKFQKPPKTSSIKETERTRKRQYNKTLVKVFSEFFFFLKDTK